MLVGSFDIKADTNKSRLYIGLSGFFREADVQPTLDALRFEAGKFQGPFDVITDISKFVPSSPKAADALKQGGELVKRCGRRRAVRVTGGIVTGLMQFKRLMGGVFEEDETVRYATSVEEADRILDNW
jgi:hypothetical protein